MCKHVSTGSSILASFVCGSMRTPPIKYCFRVFEITLRALFGSVIRKTKRRIQFLQRRTSQWGGRESQHCQVSNAVQHIAAIEVTRSESRTK